MITKHDDLLGTLVHDVAHLLRHDIDGRLKKHNLTRVKWLALGIIHKRPSLTVSELAKEMELGNAPVGRLVDRLEDRGFVKRESDPEDRRVSRLMLTNSAKSLLKELDKLGKQLRRELLAGISATEVKKLNTGLKRLKTNLKKKSAVLGSILAAILLKLNEIGELSSLAVLGAGI